MNTKLGCVKIPRLTLFFVPQSQLDPNIFHDQREVRAIPSSITRASISISIFHILRKPTAPNVIIFGETGAGKSSVVNMLPGGPVAIVKSDARGVTFEHIRYEKDIGGRRLHIFDTVGLNEGAVGTMSAAKAIEELYRLMLGLDDGVSLLVYVMRGPRIKGPFRKNYKLFYEIFCRKKVPIVLVITGLEQEDDMDDWWKRNEAEFVKEGMAFSGAACITAIKGKNNTYAQEFEESREKVEKLILGHCAQTPWIPVGGKVAWLSTLLVNNWNKLAETLDFQPIVMAQTLYEALKFYGGIEDREAKELANKIHASVTFVRSPFRLLGPDLDTYFSLLQETNGQCHHLWRHRDGKKLCR
jgi:GTP-binding protein EngB required for normal cell division